MLCSVWVIEKKMANDVRSNSFHCYLVSDGDGTAQENNTISNFRINLRHPLQFDETVHNRWHVGLTKFSCESQMYNLGPGTETHLLVRLYEDGPILRIEPPSTRVTSAEELVHVLNETIQNFERENSGYFTEEASVTQEIINKKSIASNLLPVQSDTLDKKLSLNERINFYLHTIPTKEATENYPTRKITVRIQGVEDFGMSPMMRKLLGFHRQRKLYAEAFSLRSEVYDMFSKLVKYQYEGDFETTREALKPKWDTEEMVTLYRETKGLHPYRHRVLKMQPYNVRIMWMHCRSSGQLENAMGSLIDRIMAEDRDGYLAFMQEWYPKNFIPLDYKYTLISMPSGREMTVIIPNEFITIYDYMIYKVVMTPFKQGHYTVTSDTSFTPVLFRTLWVYTNIVQPVSVNGEKNVKLLAMLLLNDNGSDTGNEVSTTFGNNNVLYKNISDTLINQIEVTITTDLGLPAPFIHGPVRLSLHFVRENTTN